MFCSFLVLSLSHLVNPGSLWSRLAGICLLTPWDEVSAFSHRQKTIQMEQDSFLLGNNHQHGLARSDLNSHHDE